MLSLSVTTRHTGTVVLEFEHSLLSLSKWEDKTGKVFLSNVQKTPEEMLDYWMLMLTSPEQDPNLVMAFQPDQQRAITEYINSTPGATSLPPPTNDKNQRHEQLTAEMIYTQMTLLRIPWEAKHWHVNKLLTMIAWVAYKQTPEKDRKDARPLREKLQDWASMNEANRKRFNSNG